MSSWRNAIAFGGGKKFSIGFNTVVTRKSRKRSYDLFPVGDTARVAPAGLKYAAGENCCGCSQGRDNSRASRRFSVPSSASEKFRYRLIFSTRPIGSINSINFMTRVGTVILYVVGRKNMSSTSDKTLRAQCISAVVKFFKCRIERPRHSDSNGASSY